MSPAGLGVVTFGHGGGADLAADLSAAVPGCRVHEQGLLDRVPEASLRSWQVGPGSLDGTVVHLRDGRELTVESAPLLARIGPALERLAAAAPSVVLYGCAGPLPAYPLPVTAVAVHPRDVLLSFVSATVRRGKVGLVVPSPLHVEPNRRAYSGPGRAVDVRAVSPADHEAVLAAVSALAADGADVVILGCFDHTLPELRAAQSVTGRPVVSSRQLALGAVAGLLSGRS